MAAAIYVLVALFGALLVFTFSMALRAFVTFRGTRLVTCPENGRSAAVEVDPRDAALAAAVGRSDLSLKDCSRWPERRDCEQKCLRQIESSPEDCLVRTILARWYEGKSCVFCGKAFQEIKWHEHKPAFVTPERITREWREIRVENLPGILATHAPVCWNCHIVETFRRRYPELLVERPWTSGEGLRMH